jgi:hypothetical protein
MSVVLVAVFSLSVLQQVSMITSGQITESFEGGFGDWVPDWNYDDAYFSVTVSGAEAYDGVNSVRASIHGLPTPPYPRTSAWIERTVSAPPSTSLDVQVSFYLLSTPLSATQLEVLAYIGNVNPEDYSDFAVIGLTDQVEDWFQYTYQNTFISSPTGLVYVAIGFYNYVVGFKAYYFDMVEISGITVDDTPPEITNLQPTNQTTISNNMPVIGADYSDESGINETSVLLMVDGGDVTPSAIVTPTGVTYTPPAPLSDATHNVYLEVEDDSSSHNRATETWWFTVDTQPPLITNLQPANESTTVDNTPTISASYSDASGIDTLSVLLRVDSTDVTGFTAVTPSGVTYTPPVPLSDDVHNVYLEVSDNSVPQNTATVTWWFSVDTQPPVITNVQPLDFSEISDNMPTIGASYSDESGIDRSSVILKVDSIDVTFSASVTYSGVTYVPSPALSDSMHSVYLAVADNNSLLSTKTWLFTVDSTPPTTILTIRNPQYTDPMSSKTFVRSVTPFNLTWNDGLGVGVESVWYLYNASGEPEPAYSQYTTDFTISSLKDDGLIFVKHKSIDELGNEEPEVTTEVYLDNTAPVTDISIGFPNYTSSGITYVKDSSPISFLADDGSGSGQDSTSYSTIKDGETEVPWTEIIGSVYLTGEDGQREILFRSEDKVNNIEIESAKTVYLDNTAPETTIITGWPSYTDSGTTYITSESSINFLVDDGDGSEAASTSYSIMKDGSTEVNWTEYTESIYLIGEDGQRTVLFKSLDNVGNSEAEKSVNVHLDNTPPTSTAQGYDESGVNYISDSLSIITIVADDGEGSGWSSTSYGIGDANCPNSYTGPLVVGTMGEGQHTVYFRSMDNVENLENITSITIFLDTTSPTADAGEDVSISEGGTVDFDGGDSDDGSQGSGISNYTWTFVYQGSVRELEGDSPQFEFGVAGTYEVTLTVKDHAGNTDTDTMTVIVRAQDVGVQFPWWILIVIAIAVVISMLLLFWILGRKKKKGKKKVSPEDTPRECESCGHDIGPQDRVCPECNNPVTQAIRR